MLKLAFLISSLLIFTTPPILATVTMCDPSVSVTSGKGPSSGSQAHPVGLAVGQATLLRVVGWRVRLLANGAPSTSMLRMRCWVSRGTVVPPKLAVVTSDMS